MVDNSEHIKQGVGRFATTPVKFNNHTIFSKSNTSNYRFIVFQKPMILAWVTKIQKSEILDNPKRVKLETNLV